MPSIEIKSVGKDIILRNKYGIYSKREIVGQLFEGHLTHKELGEIYGLKPFQIQNVFNSLGITHHSDSGDSRVVNSDINTSTHQMLIGIMMGDACMKTPRSITIEHSVHQVDYLFHLATRLHPFVASIGDKECGKGYRSFAFWTFSHKIFTSYFNRFYSNGKKKKLFTVESISDIGPEGLAYWFMDDGKYDDCGFYLCVGNVTQDEGQILIGALRERFGLEVTFQNQSTEKGYYNLYVTAKSREKFLSLVDPYIIPSMRYKLVGEAPNSVIFDVDDIARRHFDLCKKAGRPIRYFGNTSIVGSVSVSNSLRNPKDIYKDRVRENIKNGFQLSRTNFRVSPSSEELKSLLYKGMTDSFIGSTYRISRNRVAALRRSLGISRQKCRFSYDKEECVRGLLGVPGVTLKRIMNEAHVSFYVLKKWLKEKSIDFRRRP